MARKNTAPSYWSMPQRSPFVWKTFPDYINEKAEETPDEEVYVVRVRGQPRQSVTCRELKQKTETIAAGLLNKGLRRGDFVIITGVTSLEWLLCDLACVSIGVRTIRCRMSILTTEGLLTIANRNHVKAIFYHPGENRDLEVHLQSCIPEAFLIKSDGKKDCPLIPSLDFLICMTMEKQESTISVGQLFEMATDSDLEKVIKVKESLHPEDIATVYMTSGSTGFPKAIPFSHFRLINIFLQCQIYDKFHGNRHFNERSLAWFGGFAYVPLVKKCTNVYLHPLTNAEDKDVMYCIDVINEEHCDSAVILNYLMVDMLNLVNKGEAPSFALDWIMTGGEVVQRGTCKEMTKYVKNIVLSYGTTECGALASSLPDDSFDTKFKYSGFLENTLEVKVVDQAENILPMGETGELLFRSPLAFKGYLQAEAKGMPITADAWVRTSDAGCLAPGGYIQVFGRTSQVISRGNILIYPSVVEGMILACPGVSLVAVVGVPDKRLGQNICAAIVKKDNCPLQEEHLIKYFEEIYRTDEGLGMTPAYFMFLDELPLVNSKIDRTTLKKMAIEKFSLN